MYAKVTQIKNPHLRTLESFTCPEIARAVRAKFTRGLADSLMKLGQMMPIIINARREVMPTGGRYLFEAIKLLGWDGCYVQFHNVSDENLAKLKEMYP